MALSTKKKNIILAMWKTGDFKSANALANHYKISPKTARHIIGNTAHDNAELVERCVVTENDKKSLKNPQELKALESVVKKRTIADEIHDIVMSATKANVKAIKKVIKKGKAVKVVTEGEGKGFTTARKIELDMGPEHYKAAQEGLDKALITAGKAARHAPRGDVHVGDNNNITGVIEYIIEMPIEDNLDEQDVIEVEPIKDDNE